MNSVELRAVLVDLESAVETAGTALQVAEAAHKVAVTRAVLHGRHSEADKSEAALTVARVAHNRTVERRDEARLLLAEATKREKVEAQAIVRTEVEAELADIAAVARDIDTKFAEVAADLVNLHAREAALHRKVRGSFRSPWAAPRILTSARSLSAFLMALANGFPQDLKPHVADIVGSATHNVRATFDE